MASEQLAKRCANRWQILRSLHFEGPLTRGELNARLGIRKSSITSIVKELLDRELVRDDPPGSFRSRLSLRCDRHVAIAASITPQTVHVGVVRLDGAISWRTERPFPQGARPETVLADLAAAVREAESRAGAAVMGLGVSIPGLVNPHTGSLIKAVNLDGWADVSVATLLAAQLGWHVRVDNDVRCQMRASAWFDRLAGEADDAIYVHVGDGVSCSILAHGRLVVGDRLAAGEIGHTRGGSDGRTCRCGRRDCVEAYCSVPALLHDAGILLRDPDALRTGEALARAATDPRIAALLDGMAGRLSSCLAGLVAAVDPHTLVLGMADQALSERIAPMLERHLARELIGLDAGRLHIRVGQDALTASLKGAGALLIRDAFEGPDYFPPWAADASRA